MGHAGGGRRGAVAGRQADWAGRGGLGPGAAATRAPLILWAVLCTLAGVGLYAWNCRQENRQYEAAARRQQADEAAAKTMDKRGRRRKAG